MFPTTVLLTSPILSSVLTYTRKLGSHFIKFDEHTYIEGVCLMGCCAV
jgi:hypothetical protein